MFGTPVFDGLLGVNGAACLTVMRAELGEKRVEAARQDNKHGSEVCDMIRTHRQGIADGIIAHADSRVP